MKNNPEFFFKKQFFHKEKKIKKNFSEKRV